jgi:hypothetical protein
MTYGYNAPRYITPITDGWQLKGVLPNSFNTRMMIFSLDRDSAADAVIDVDTRIVTPDKKKENLFQTRIKVCDIMKKNIYVMANKYLSHLVFHHNDQPVLLPPASGKKKLNFSVICTPALPQSVFWVMVVLAVFAILLYLISYLFSKNGKGGISCKLAGALEMALLFALVESFLAGTSNHSFIWVYKWWGVLPVFITTYIPFFLASNYVPDMEPKKRNLFLVTEWALVAVLLVILIPAGVI